MCGEEQESFSDNLGRIEEGDSSFPRYPFANNDWCTLSISSQWMEQPPTPPPSSNGSQSLSLERSSHLVCSVCSERFPRNFFTISQIFKGPPTPLFTYSLSSESLRYPYTSLFPFPSFLPFLARSHLILSSKGVKRKCTACVQRAANLRLIDCFMCGNSLAVRSEFLLLHHIN